MRHLKKGVENMEKKEEVKLKSKQDIKKQEYTVEEFAQAAQSLLQTEPECVIAAFQLAGIQKATEEQAKKIVKDFLKTEV